MYAFSLSPLVGVNLSLLADEVGETAAHSPDGGQRVLHLKHRVGNTTDRKTKQNEHVKRGGARDKRQSRGACKIQ